MALETDVDLRLETLWRDALEIEDWNTELVGRFLRSAYAMGYWDALKEPRRGSLCTDHGYRIPKRDRAG